MPASRAARSSTCAGDESSSRRRPSGTRHRQVQLALSSYPTNSAARPARVGLQVALTLHLRRRFRFHAVDMDARRSRRLRARTSRARHGSGPRSGCTVQHTPWTYASARTHRRRGGTGHRLCLARTPRFPRARIARLAANAFQTSRGERQHVTPTASSDLTELADGVPLLRFMSEERVGLSAPSVMALLPDAWCDWALQARAGSSTRRPVAWCGRVDKWPITDEVWRLRARRWPVEG